MATVVMCKVATALGVAMTREVQATRIGVAVLTVGGRMGRAAIEAGTLTPGQAIGVAIGVDRMAPNQIALN